MGRESGPSCGKRRAESSDSENDSSDGDSDGEQMVSVGRNCGIIALEALDCTVCNQPLRVPILQKNDHCPLRPPYGQILHPPLATGHVICLYCHRELRNKDKCYVCSITGGYNRCIALEKILKSVQTPCCNTKYGCTVKTATHYLQGADHEKSCPCAPCFCPQSDCDFTGSTTELLDHLTFVDHCPSTEFEYGRRFDLQIQEGVHVLYTRDGGSLFQVKFTPVHPFRNAASIVCIDPHAVARERKFRCLVGSNCSTASWRSSFLTISSNVYDRFTTEDGSYSLVVPTLSSDRGINVTITKV